MAKKPKVELFPATDHCPGFWKVNYISGCPYRCRFCYLDFSTGRMNGGNKIISIAAEADALAVVKRWAEKMGDTPALLNTGETGDSFAFDEAEAANISLVEWLRGRKQAILFLTKSSSPSMASAPTTTEAVYSFSVNPREVCRAFNAPFVSLELLRTLNDQGKRIRLRLDPLIPIPGWMTAYEYYLNELAREVFVNRHPEMITLGSLRSTDGNYRLRVSQGVDLIQHLVKESDGGHHPWRVPREVRTGMYRVILEMARRHFPGTRFGVCKETGVTRHELGVLTGDCNCML